MSNRLVNHSVEAAVVCRDLKSHTTTMLSLSSSSCFSFSLAELYSFYFLVKSASVEVKMFLDVFIVQGLLGFFEPPFALCCIKKKSILYDHTSRGLRVVLIIGFYLPLNFVRNLKLPTLSLSVVGILTHSQVKFHTIQIGYKFDL